jgi:hypothetical protein
MKVIKIFFFFIVYLIRMMWPGRYEIIFQTEKSDFVLCMFNSVPTRCTLYSLFRSSLDLN